MMSVFAKLGPDGPTLEITGNYFRVGEVSEELAAMGAAHTVKHETDNRARLIIALPVPDTRKEAKAKL